PLRRSTRARGKGPPEPQRRNSWERRLALPPRRLPDRRRSGRVSAASLPSMLCTWLFTVFVEMLSCRAISLLPSPAVIRSLISCSRFVSRTASPRRLSIPCLRSDETLRSTRRVTQATVHPLFGRHHFRDGEL